MAWQSVTDPSAGGKLHTVIHDSGLVVGGVGKVWQSDDSGATWTELGAGQLPLVPISAIIRNSSGEVVIGTSKAVVGGVTIYPRVYRLVSGTWQLATGLPTNTSLKISDFASAYGSLFVCTAYQGDIYRSNNGGSAWTLYATNALVRALGSVTGALWALGTDASGVLIASGELATSGLFKDPQTPGFQWLQIGPFDVDGYSANEKQWLVLPDGTIFAGRRHTEGKYISKLTPGGSWVRSSNGLAVWQVVTALIADAASTLWESQQPTSGAGKVYRSVDGGANWIESMDGLSTHAVMFATDANYVYMLGQASGIYRIVIGG